MDSYSRFPAVFAYVPVVGWLYALMLQRSNPLAVFHARQAIGLVLFIAAVFVAWIVVGWLLAWLPYGIIFSSAAFALVLGAFIFGAIALLVVLLNAARGRVAYLPIVGKLANRLPL